MKTLSIALKDLQIVFKDRGAVVQLLLLPLLFIVVFSGALAALGGGGDEDERILLPVADLDGGEAAETLINGIEGAGGVRVEPYSSEEAQSLLDGGELARVLTVPEGFTADIAERRQTVIRLTTHQDANPQETEAVRLVVVGAAQDMSLETQILASLEQMGEMQANAPEEFRVFTVDRTVAQARSQFERSRTQPLVDVVQRLPAQEEVEQAKTPESIQLAVPGFTVLFVFLTAQATARSIYDEKRVGSFRRLLAAPISRASLLAGKILPNLVTGLVQTGVIFAFGVFGMRLLGLTPLTLGREPVGVALVAVLVALCSTSLGIVIAAIARTENQIGGLSSLVLWMMAVLGGSFVPLYILENFLGPLPQIVPHYWASRAFNDLLVRGLGLADVGLELVVLLGFTALFLLVGVWRFEFD